MYTFVYFNGFVWFSDILSILLFCLRWPCIFKHLFWHWLPTIQHRALMCNCCLLNNLCLMYRFEAICMKANTKRHWNGRTKHNYWILELIGFMISKINKNVQSFIKCIALACHCNGFGCNNNISNTKYNKYSRLIWLFVTFGQRLISSLPSIGIWNQLNDGENNK